jgi:hypothetical protein
MYIVREKGSLVQHTETHITSHHNTAHHSIVKMDPRENTECPPPCLRPSSHPSFAPLSLYPPSFSLPPSLSLSFTLTLPSYLQVNSLMPGGFKVTPYCCKASLFPRDEASVKYADICNSANSSRANIFVISLITLLTACYIAFL